MLPFWFTPAYFTGNIVLDTKTGDVLQFNLHVPTANELNVGMLLGLINIFFLDDLNSLELILTMKEVFLLQFGNVKDLEWYGSNRPDDNLMVDIGYLPAMELKSTMSYSEENAYNWSDEISVEEAHKTLEKAFFPFKQVYSYFGF